MSFDEKQMNSPAERQSDVAEVSARTRLPASAVLVLAHIDPLAFGVALGSVLGLSVSAATIILLVKGGPNVGANLALLSQYFLGYRVTLLGSLVGFLYAAVTGFMLGYLFARTRNYLIHTYLIYIRRRAEQKILSDLLDRMV